MNEVAKKKVLMLCYYYPPVNNGGVERSIKFAKYLPQYGWQPVIITTDLQGSQPAEKERRIFTPELLSIYRRIFKEERRSGEGAEADTRPRAEETSGKLKKAVLGVLRRLLVPDLRVGWIVFAFWPAWHSLRIGETEAIYTTSPPVSSHLLGLALKMLTGKPWVMDLRDPWTFEPMNELLREPGLRLPLEKRMEHMCFEYADAIVLNTPEATERYKLLYPHFTSKMRTITNGFDSKEMTQAAALDPELPTKRAPDRETFIISHIGTVTSRSTRGGTDLTPHALLEALAELLEEGVVSASNFQVIFVGNLDARTRSYISELGLDGLIETSSVVPHLEALNLMLHSDLLLLLDTTGTGQTYVHGKLYEYLGSGKPVLGILPLGASRELLKRSGEGLLVSPDDREGIRKAVVQAMRQEHRVQPDPDFELAAYERKQLAGFLAETLDKVSSSGNSQS